ncbi:hypothetical protein ENC_35220 [Enterobacter hormaechei]|nr:hypothetical protein ENC_35220 [Enterobacter hormaechei]
MSVSDQIDMSALQSNHSAHYFQRMRLMKAYGTEFNLIERKNRLRIRRHLTIRLTATQLENSERY